MIFIIAFKSKYSNYNDDLKLYIDGNELSHKSLIKNLGIYFDQHLTFHDITKTVQWAFPKL